MQTAYDHNKVVQKVSEKKRKLFFEYSGNILASTMELYDAINNEKEIDSTKRNWYLNGGNVVIDKSAFADNQAADHMNYHSFLASSISERYKAGISELFYYNATSRYLIKAKDIGNALEKLEVNPEEYQIVAFGINDHYYNNLVPTYSETKLTFGLKTFLFTHCNYALLKESIFVVPKSNLPKISHLEIDSESRKKYSMESINADRNIFASVIDLFQNEGIRNEIAENYPDENLLQSVYLLITTNTQVKWKDNIKMIALRIYSEYGDKGTPIDVADIKSFSKS